MEVTSINLALFYLLEKIQPTFWGRVLHKGMNQKVGPSWSILRVFLSLNVSDSVIKLSNINSQPMLSPIEIFTVRHVNATILVNGMWTEFLMHIQKGFCFFHMRRDM